jgi:hypothetical protein
VRASLLAALVILLPALPGCVAYEYEHEFWLKVDGSGSVNVTGRPGLWRAFKGVGGGAESDPEALRSAVRSAFEAAGLRVRRVSVTRREDRPYLFVAADFSDVNRLAGSAAFPDLRLGLRREAGRLVLEGEWRRPAGLADPAADRDGLMAVRFHLPSRVFDHANAFAGVERGNIVSWRQDVAAGLTGTSLAFGATMDERSILGSTVRLFAAAIALALGILGLALWMTARRGRRRRAV